jgi:hypothetical protein
LEVPISERFHPSFVASLIDVSAVDPVPEEGWITADEGQTFGPPPPPQSGVPQFVTSAQGGIALIQAGRMDAVLAIVNDPATPPEIKWAWERAQNWERSSPALAYLAERAGISDTDMDSYFLTASQIQA